jgi:hypothetical protein
VNFIAAPDENRISDILQDTLLQWRCDGIETPISKFRDNLIASQSRPCVTFPCLLDPDLR